MDHRFEFSITYTIIQGVSGDQIELAWVLPQKSISLTVELIATGTPICNYLWHFISDRKLMPVQGAVMYSNYQGGSR